MRTLLCSTVTRASTRHNRSSLTRSFHRSLATSNDDTILETLRAVQEGRLSLTDAHSRIGHYDDPTHHYANLDLRRSRRAGFPEAVFAEGKTSHQTAQILDRMAAASEAPHQSPILATR